MKSTRLILTVGAILICTFAIDNVVFSEVNVCSVASSIPLRVEKPHDIFWKDSCLWISDVQTGSLYRIDPSDGSILNTLKLPVSNSSTITYGQSKFFSISATKEVNEIGEDNKISHSFFYSFETPAVDHELSRKIKACCYCDSTVYVCYEAGMSSCIRRFNSAVSSMEHFAFLSGYPRGIAYDGRDLWCCTFSSHQTHGLIEKYKDRGGTDSVLYELPFNNPLGLAWDGFNFWTIDLDNMIVCRIHP